MLEQGSCGLVMVVSHPNRLMPQHIALYRSPAEKRTIKHSESTRRVVMIEKVLVGAVGAVIAVGLAAPASASPVPPPPTPQDFLAAARAAGITGTDPAMLEDGYQVCRRLW